MSKWRIERDKDRIKELEEEIAEWKQKYITVCEKKDELENDLSNVYQCCECGKDLK